MSDKLIKNDQWYVKDLISKINNNNITKPKFQRKRKWDIHPKKENVPNEQSYIEFLFKTRNSVHSITFGQEINEKIYYSNIDGNNRINAIKHFIDKPFEIFNKCLNDLFDFIESIDLENKDKEFLKQTFQDISYNDIINFKYNKYFLEDYLDLYNNKLKIYRDEFEIEIEKIQKKIMINGTERFDTNVIINVNLFEGYNTDELCQTFEEINKFNSTLTPTELLACKLFNEDKFVINDNIFKAELEEYIKEYYENKSKNEALICYKFDNDKINAHDFIVGYQNLSCKKYKFIDETDSNGLSLFFKLYKALYGGFTDKFNTHNVNDFIKKVEYTCDIINKTLSEIFTDKISDKLFNGSCQKKLKTLKKNNVLLIMCSVIGFMNKNEPDKSIKQKLEKCILYHFMVGDILDKTVREQFQSDDKILYQGGTSILDYSIRHFLQEPDQINNKLDKKKFTELIEYLICQSNDPVERTLDNGRRKRNERRKLRFYEKTLMFYYYKTKIPVEQLANDFWIEHIFPNSSDWDGELDKDRLGNLIPIISEMNNMRGNRHINEYNKTDRGKQFCKFIKDIIPCNDKYDKIMSHENRKVFVKDIEKFNQLCLKNEEIYKNNFIKCIFN